MANDVLKLADECEESAQAWANEVDTRKRAAAALRQQESAIAELRQRADTAEARLERAKAVLRGCAEQMGNCCPTCSEDRIAEITAFLGEGK